MGKGQTSSASTTQMSTAHQPWPKRSSLTTQSHPNPSPVMNGGNLRPIVLPKFMSTPETFGETGYQKAHQLYDEMRRFFARKALAEYQNEVVVIKFTMMSLKPGYKNPQVVSVGSPELYHISGADSGIDG
jgi:hypothetical protein